MLTLLLSALMATAPITGEISEKADTINRFTIDGKAVSNFDGSQLIGLSIANYDITVSKEKEKVVRNHKITTVRNKDKTNDKSAYYDKNIEGKKKAEEPTSKMIMEMMNSNGRISSGRVSNGRISTSDNGNAHLETAVAMPMELNEMDSAIWYLDEVKIKSKEKLKDIKPTDIKSIAVLKGAAAEAIYGPEARKGVIDIKTKKK